MPHINRFYESRDKATRYISSDSEDRWVDPSRKIKPFHLHSEDSGYPIRLTAFHFLRQGRHGPSYAAVYGAGIVNVKVMLGSYSEALMQEYINKRNAQIEAFKKFGFVSIDGPVYYTHFFDTKIQKWIVVSHYNPGIGFSQLGKYLPPDKQREAFIKFVDFEENVIEMIKTNSKYLGLNREHIHRIVEEQAVYYDGSWSFNFY